MFKVSNKKLWTYFTDLFIVDFEQVAITKLHLYDFENAFWDLKDNWMFFHTNHNTLGLYSIYGMELLIQFGKTVATGWQLKSIEM